ncbi:hypothetical protein SAPIO_CDS7166 [Scedosporium apiospermum]|uniref:DNA-directed RNA polymerases I, II, and III subunit RPABC1 n=1 Tax=Pseudallescheria apiosperma TaxID=563466 RepID=A0A084G191_PSEDA|nr:uncharacterized protein SAPIO_CDS7166 [Scedosporium apiospermum]KEZ41103.1 hypothetical protein SAPIO_CDS7166 [Scedosporium apiospermum]
MSDDPQLPRASDKEITRMWRVYRTVMEMVSDREYELAEDEVKISLNQFRNKFVDQSGQIVRQLLQFSARPSDTMIRKFTPPATPENPNPEPDCGTIFVQFISSDNMGVSQVKDFIQTVVGQHARVGILITRVPLTPAARKFIAVAESYAQLECFIEEDLLVNITHHELVPRHVLLSKEEKVALLKRYRLKETQLPRILQKDPVARYLGLRRGQVVKIIRNSETAGRYASYRLCV